MWNSIRKTDTGYEYEDQNGKRPATDEEVREYQGAKIDHLLADEE